MPRLWNPGASILWHEGNCLILGTFGVSLSHPGENHSPDVGNFGFHVVARPKSPKFMELMVSMLQNDEELPKSCELRVSISWRVETACLVYL